MVGLWFYHSRVVIWKNCNKVMKLVVILDLHSYKYTFPISHAHPCDLHFTLSKFLYFCHITFYYLLFCSHLCSLFCVFFLFFTCSIQYVLNLSIQSTYRQIFNFGYYWLKCPKQNSNWTQPKPSQPKNRSKKNPAVNIFMLSGKEAEVFILGIMIQCTDTLLLEIERCS